jgi:hypothetical protein
VELRLTAVDSWGLAATVTQSLEPNRVDLTFDSAPTGLVLLLDGFPVTASRTVTSWEAHAISTGLASPVQEDGAGLGWRFSGWSDGGAETHAVVTPASAATYLASFAPLADLALAPSLLRNDVVADLASAAAQRPAIFAASPSDPSLEEFGPNRLGDAGEGALTAGNGSSDDDDCYLHAPAPGALDPDALVLADAARPLVFYQLDQAGRLLRLVKVPGGLTVSY